MFFLITGGARSGKSTLAVNIGRSHLGKVIFIATAPNLDDDMSERITRHQLERPDWETIEEECEILSHLKRGKSGDLLIVDCITLWVSNLLFHGKTEKEIIEAAIEISQVARTSPCAFVMVTNEVGMGIHPETDLGREYRDLLGKVNQILVKESTKALFVISGRVMNLHNFSDIDDFTFQQGISS